MIDLTTLKRCLEQVDTLVEHLHGKDLDERKAVGEQTKSLDRTTRGQLSQDLNLLASKLDLAAALARNEYWVARGEPDPLRPRR